MGMIVLVALIGAAFCWRMVPRSFDSLLPDEQEREEEAFSITFLGSGTMPVSIYPEGSLLVYYMIGSEACEELMAYIQGHGINENDDAAQETSGETVSRDQQISITSYISCEAHKFRRCLKGIGENEAAEITDSQKAEDSFLSDEERYAGMLVGHEDYPELYEAAEEMLNDREAIKTSRQMALGIQWFRTVSIFSGMVCLMRCL
ncbi:MAG: hypothetical protein LUH58_02675 [Lachnospiraceae bacterium]|nr:hypothetical protein [Lachnospiraceae bacterium]